MGQRMLTLYNIHVICHVSDISKLHSTVDYNRHHYISDIPDYLILCCKFYSYVLSQLYIIYDGSPKALQVSHAVSTLLLAGWWEKC